MQLLRKVLRLTNKDEYQIKKRTKMKSLTTIITIAFLAFSTTACSQQHSYYSRGFFKGKTIKASKNYVTKVIKTDNFIRLSVAGSPDVSYTQKAGKPEVKIYTSDNIVDLLDIQVKDNTLHIGFKKNVSITYGKLEISVSAEKLNGIAVAGSGNVELANGLKTDELQISVAGSGDINGENISCTDLSISIAGSGNINSSNITCNNLKTSIAGSGDMKLNNVTTVSAGVSVAGSGTVILNGSTQEAAYSVTGSGDLFASDFVAKKVSANVTGSGDIKCHATDFLKVRTSGSGSVGYKGNPELDYPKKGLYKL